MAAQGKGPLRNTRDLPLAAWMKMKGLRIVSAARRGRHEFAFAFADPDQRWDDLEVEFTNSESRLFDDSMRSIKKLAGKNGQR